MITAYEPMEFTGERMVPEKAEASTFWEHVYRYRFAIPYVHGKRVLDIACGEGYGTAALLKAGASSVIGVDISEESCRHARAKYGLDARVGDAEAIPLPDASVDVIVSFETIEHVPHPEKFLDECLRVLVPNGLLIISTPDKNIYKVVGDQNNPFHLSELTEDEFAAKINERFTNYQLFTQHPKAAPHRSPRSFSVDNSSWEQMRGMRRLKRKLVSVLCPHISSAANEGVRAKVIDIILSRDNPLSSWLNPYVVKRKSRWAPENAAYLVAVAQK